MSLFKSSEPFFLSKYLKRTDKRQNSINIQHYSISSRVLFDFSFILISLIHRMIYCKIYCINRTEKTKYKHEKAENNREEKRKEEWTKKVWMLSVNFPFVFVSSFKVKHTLIFMTHTASGRWEKTNWIVAFLRRFETFFYHIKS